MKKRIHLLLIAFFLIIPFQANAKLLISPYNLVMENRDRTGQISVVNTSNQPVTYRLGWEQVEQSPNQPGGYVDTVMRDDVNYLQNFAVFSPRQFTLKPDEKQTIRMAVRRPANLPDGEYKSHLKFEIIPDPSQREQVYDSIVAMVNMSYSIPIVYRVGAYDAQITIDDPVISVSPETQNLVLSIPVNRTGMHGVLGRIDVFHTPNGGEETRLVQLGNNNIFPEVSSRTFKAPLNVQGLEPGKLRIVFIKAEGKRDKYVDMAEKVIDIQN